jgi:hypothetical protein
MKISSFCIVSIEAEFHPVLTQIAVKIFDKFIVNVQMGLISNRKCFILLPSFKQKINPASTGSMQYCITNILNISASSILYSKQIKIMNQGTRWVFLMDPKTGDFKNLVQMYF